MSTFIIQTAAAQMPSSCKGRYRRVAVLEVEDGLERVAMISERARGVIRIVQTWEKLNVGISARCAYQRALRDARDLVFSLSVGRDLVRADLPVLSDMLLSHSGEFEGVRYA